MILRPFLLLVPLLLTACGSQPIRGGAEDATLTVGAPDRGMAGEIGEIVLVDGQRGTVIDRYHAASGRLCQRLRMIGGTASPRVACRDDAGSWSLRRALDVSSSPRLIAMPDAMPDG